jgi:hypothetical protein
MRGVTTAPACKPCSPPNGPPAPQALRSTRNTKRRQQSPGTTRSKRANSNRCKQAGPTFLGEHERLVVHHRVDVAAERRQEVDAFRRHRRHRHVRVKLCDQSARRFIGSVGKHGARGEDRGAKRTARLTSSLPCTSSSLMRPHSSAQPMSRKLMMRGARKATLTHNLLKLLVISGLHG